MDEQRFHTDKPSIRNEPGLKERDLNDPGREHSGGQGLHGKDSRGNDPDGKDSDRQDSSAKVPARDQNTPRPAVLIVDGNPALLQTCRSIFSNSAYGCVTAGDTLAALCAVVEHEPVAVLIDADTGPLPVWQFCVLLRQQPACRDIRLIISSNTDNAVARARASASGADNFLPRPFTAEEVLALLDTAGGQTA